MNFNNSSFSSDAVGFEGLSQGPWLSLQLKRVPRINNLKGSSKLEVLIFD